MKLKHRLSLYSVVIFGVSTLIISSVIYISYYTQMEKKEQQSLESKSLLAAIYYLEKDELSLLEHENIKSQLLKAISRRNIIVYDMSDKKFGGEMTSDDDITTDFVERIRTEKTGFFDTGDFFYNGIFYRDNQGDFVVITREPKDEFNTQMRSLLHILMAVSLLGLIFIYFFSRYLGHIAYAPIIHIIEQIKDRDAKNFNEPISLQRSYAEVEDLVLTYNHFVDRIAQTFHVQKNFIDYVSHELRTPITALLGTLEVTDQRKRTGEEYENVMVQLKQYTHDLQETLDQMMLLSGAKTNFEFVAIRIDEIIWKAIENAVLYHQAKIEVDIQVDDTECLRLEGNDKLLELAFNNLIENAIKYSDNSPIHINLFMQDQHLQVVIIDQGIGIDESDLKHVKENFFRGQNAQRYQGKGIGLSMAHIIFNLHHVDMDIFSNSSGTQVQLTF